MKFDVYGTVIEIVRRQENWKVFYIGNEGKKRLAEDVVIPAGVDESQLLEYLADLRHEYASPLQQDVVRLD